MKIKFIHSYREIISLENLIVAWQEFVNGKGQKKDVQEFSLSLMDNLFSLHRDLVNCTYRHGGYQKFNISDPKPRNIHKASVRDRLLHHAVYRTLYPFFDRIFMTDSFSCRLGKGTHKALDRFRYFFRKMSKNNQRTCWVLKGDIKRFFASVNQEILVGILEKYIPDAQIIWLLKDIIGSFSSSRPGIGLPLGNLTSQLLVNIYMNEFERFVKHKLKAKYYLRYADDFVFLHENRRVLEGYIPLIRSFLENNLQLQLHPQKVYIKTLSSGVDFLGWVHFPDHRVLRAATKRRMYKRIVKSPKKETLQSYLGMLKHGNSYKVKEKLLTTYQRLV